MNELFEMAEDLDLHSVRMSVNGNTVIIDNISKVVIMSDTNITTDYGRGQISVYGTGLCIEYIYDGRMRIHGNISGIEFFRKNR